MKNKRLIVTALLALAVSFIPLTAKAGDDISVTYQVDPSYEVVIPSDTTIPFMSEEAAFGTIQIKEAVLEEDKCILVEMNSGGYLINEENPNSQIPYQIINKDEPFTCQKYTKAGEETKLYISIKKEDWEKAIGGKYKTEITFTISYVDKEYIKTSQSESEAVVPTTHTVVIETMVPTTHTVAIDAEHASALYVEGDKGLSDAYPIPRFSNPQFKLSAEDGYIIKRVLLNGTDVTKEIKNDTLMLHTVCENRIIRIETEAIPQETTQTPEKPEDEEETVQNQETEEQLPETQPSKAENETDETDAEKESETAGNTQEVTSTETLREQEETTTEALQEETTTEASQEQEEIEQTTSGESISPTSEENVKHFNFWWLALLPLSAGIFAGSIFLIKKRKSN